MKFEYKRTQVTREARKKLPREAKEIQAFKVRPKGEELVGTVVGFGYGDDGAEGWAYMREGKLYGGFDNRHDASEALAKS